MGQVDLKKIENCKILSSPFVDIFIYPYITTVWWLSVILLLWIFKITFFCALYCYLWFTDLYLLKFTYLFLFYIFYTLGGSYLSKNRWEQLEVGLTKAHFHFKSLCNVIISLSLVFEILCRLEYGVLGILHCFDALFYL